MTDPFRRLTTLTVDPAWQRADSMRLSAYIDPTWTIGDKVHGGVLTALCARAATDSIADPALAPLSVSATYLAAPDPGEVTVTTTLLRRGRTVTHVDVELAQGDRVAVRAAVTLGDPGSARGSAADDPESAAAMAPDPDDGPTPGIGHPLASIVNLSAQCDMRLDATSAPFLDGATGAACVRLWVRPRAGDDADPATRELFALMAGDICPPVTMNLGLFGWAPTVQLTTYLRARPAPGWLRVSNRSTVVGSTWFEEDHTVVDSTGAVVVQSRQLALVPRTG